MHKSKAVKILSDLENYCYTRTEQLEHEFLYESDKMSKTQKARNNGEGLAYLNMAEKLTEAIDQLVYK